MDVTKRNNVLQQKLAIIFFLNMLTVTLDTSAKYYIINKQLSTNSQPNNSSAIAQIITVLTGDNVKSVCYAMGTYGDARYMNGYNNVFDGDDLSDVIKNSWWLTLHLSKTAIRSLEVLSAYNNWRQR